MMFEKWRIKQHMEVTDSTGQHVGTVDSVDGDRIKLTRSDSADGRHHYLDIDQIDKIAENRAWLKPDASLSDTAAAGTTSASADDEAEAFSGRPASAGQHASPGAASEGAPLVGTNGHGTGMGGSGVV